MPFVTSYVSVYPDMLSAAASDLRVIEAELAAATAASAAPTGGVIPAAADEVSVLTAAQFATHAGRYQEVAAQATAVHDLLVTTLAGSAASYAATEAANAVAAG
ncbi:PE family protein [Mycobacterium sp. SM1]|uniref:PE family protein n=1 Tax=Mycobacterium sp. SM1 TaxID=2816243 RepID=UPI001BCF6682|nr:PE family protein [Mycobacterium sp. SM1]MBS4729204.1 PE family protein [Mycobacterium sp. SM1]